MNHIARLEELRDAGVLTDEEFEAAKERIPPTNPQLEMVALVDLLNQAGHLGKDEAEIIRGRVLNRHVEAPERDWREHETALAAALKGHKKELTRVNEMLTELRSPARVGAVRENARRVPASKAS